MNVRYEKSNNCALRPKAVHAQNRECHVCAARTRVDGERGGAKIIFVDVAVRVIVTSAKLES